MKDLIARILQWMTYSTYFKKWSGILGGWAGGMWFVISYHEQIKKTLEAWGVTGDEWKAFLLAVMGVCGIALSTALSVAKTKADEKQAESPGGTNHV